MSCAWSAGRSIRVSPSPNRSVSSRDRLRALLAGCLAGLAGGLFGVGGGLVMIPILTGSFKLTQHEAHGTSLAVIGITALVSLIVYAMYSNVGWITAAIVAPTSLITARLGARLATKTSQRDLARAFAVALAVVALRLLWKTPEPNGWHMSSGAMRLGFDILLGLGVGIVSGYMGVGGGILMVPALTLLMGVPQQIAQGTSLAVMLVAAPAGAIEHSRHDNVLWGLVPLLAVGAVVGGPLAAWSVQQIPHAILAKAFAVFLLANAVQTWLRAYRLPRSRSGRRTARARVGS